MALAADGPRREEIELFRSTVSNARDKLMEKEAENQRLREQLEKLGYGESPSEANIGQNEEEEEEPTNATEAPADAAPAEEAEAVQGDPTAVEVSEAPPPAATEDAAPVPDAEPNTDPGV